MRVYVCMYGRYHVRVVGVVRTMHLWCSDRAEQGTGHRTQVPKEKLFHIL